MIHRRAVESDIKLIIREPVLVIFSILPLFLFILLHYTKIYLLPYLYRIIEIELSMYYGYAQGLALLMPASMLGTICGFMMIDDRDANMFELMSITPLGYSGYIATRASIPFFGGLLYTFIGYGLFSMVPISKGLLLFTSLLIGFNGVLFGLMLFTFADDKVKGLTYSKGLNILNFLAIADALEMPWLSLLASLTPFYWVVKGVRSGPSLEIVALSLLVHLFWFLFFLKRSQRV